LKKKKQSHALRLNPSGKLPKEPKIAEELEEIDCLPIFGAKGCW